MDKIDYRIAALQAKKYGYNPNKFHEPAESLTSFNNLNSSNEIPSEDISEIESSPEAKQCGKSLREVLMFKNGQRRLSQL